jgi:hypothetical protein
MTPFRLALCLLALGLVGAWQVTLIPESPIQMPVGPILTPAVVVGLLLVIALLYGLSAWRGRQLDAVLGDDGQPLPGANRRMLMLHARLVAAWLTGEIPTLTFLTTR